MNVNQKGNIGLIKTMECLYEQGFYCYPAFDDYSPVDLIAMAADGKTYRLQVKYRAESANQERYYEIHFSSVVNGKRVRINESLVDAWAIYMAERDEVVFLPVEEVRGRTAHYIRQSHLKEEYKFVKKELNGESTGQGTRPDC